MARPCLPLLQAAAGINLRAGTSDLDLQFMELAVERLSGAIGEEVITAAGQYPVETAAEVVCVGYRDAAGSACERLEAQIAAQRIERLIIKLESSQPRAQTFRRHQHSAVGRCALRSQDR